MIFNETLVKDAEYIGDIQENKVGIDTKNIGFITQLLTSNLYSKPFESFIREAVSNAYDSHVEAGTDEYILLYIRELDKYNKHRVSIRDYGVGLSPERFYEVYTNIAGSTKRSTNDFIGGFGIGRMSCLAVADVATITSYYHNTKYVYLMYKNTDGSINIDKMSETQGNFKDGLEVSVETSLRDYDIKEAISKLIMFEKLYVQYDAEDGLSKNFYVSSFINEFNDRKFAHFKTFSICSCHTNHSVAYSIGNVLYNGAYDLSENLHSSRIILHVPVGSVDIVPSRENLQFTERTMKVLNQTIKDFKKEAAEILFKEFNNKDFTLTEYFQKMTTGGYSFGDEICINIDYLDVEGYLEKWNMTINGNVIPKDYRTYLMDVEYQYIPKESVYDAYIRGKSTKAGVALSRLLKGEYSVYVKTSPTFKNYTKEWLVDKGKQENLVVLRPECVGIEGLGLNDTRSWNRSYDTKECAEFTLKNLEYTGLKNEDVPQEFIDAYNIRREFLRKDKKQKVSVEDKKNIPCRFYNNYGYHNGTIDINNYNVIFYSANTKEDEEIKQFRDFLSRVRDITVTVVTVKAKNLYLFDNDQRCFPLSDLSLRKNNFLAKCITAHKIYCNLTPLRNTPLWYEYTVKYDRYLGINHYYDGYDFIKDLISTYETNGWLNACDINYFQATDSEKEMRSFWYKVRDNIDKIAEALVCRKYGTSKRMGFEKPINLSKYL